jgi:uncharacterized protein (DUF427 family)
MGDRTYWDLSTGIQRAENAAYAWEQPPDGAAQIAGLIAFDWDSVTVFEEVASQVRCKSADAVFLSLG